MPLDKDKNRPIPTTAHWGTYYAEVENGKLTGLRDYEKDPSPSIIGQGILEALDDKVRVRRPMVRKGFLENGKSSNCLLYTSPSPRDRQKSRMPSSA